jgi:hypothetical protein
MSDTHAWQVIWDYEGDPSVPNGTNTFKYYRCVWCGIEKYTLDEDDEIYTPEIDVD